MKRAKGARGKCDRVFSLIIRSAGECAACDYRCTCPQRPHKHTASCRLQCAHVVSRSYSHTRCDTRNAVCLCAGCHRHFTNNPVEWGRWVDSTLGAGHYDAVWHDARQTGGQRVDWEAVYVELQAEAALRGIDL